MRLSSGGERRLVGQLSIDDVNCIWHVDASQPLAFLPIVVFHSIIRYQVSPALTLTSMPPRLL
jgi:hypothetical protein